MAVRHAEKAAEALCKQVVTTAFAAASRPLSAMPQTIAGDPLTPSPQINRTRVGNRAWRRVIRHMAGRVTCERVLMGHKDVVESVAVFPDGRIVSASW